MNIAAPQLVHKPLYPPDYAFKKLRGVVPKPVDLNLELLKIAKGLAEPEGAPGKGGENESLKEEARLNRMSLAQLRVLIVGAIEKQQAFELKWSYPEPEELDTPADQNGNRASNEATQAYWKRLAAKRKLEEEVRPTKRAKDFHKQIPGLGYRRSVFWR